MTNVEDTTCTASYGASANLVSSGGKSIVGYVKQLSEYLSNLSYQVSRQGQTPPLHPAFFWL